MNFQARFISGKQSQMCKEWLCSLLCVNHSPRFTRTNNVNKAIMAKPKILMFFVLMSKFWDVINSAVECSAFSCFWICKFSFLNISKLYYCHQLSSSGNICSTNHSHPGLQVFHKTRNNYCSTTAGGKTLVKMIKSCLALEDMSFSCEFQCHIWDILAPFMEKLSYQVELMNH